MPSGDHDGWRASIALSVIGLAVPPLAGIVHNVPEARAVVRRLARKGVSVIKVAVEWKGGADWPVLTVAMRSGDAAAVAKALGSRGLDWPTAIDPDGSIAARYGLHGVPALVVVDGRGEIRSVMVGYTTMVGMQLRMWWASLGI